MPDVVSGFLFFSFAPALLSNRCCCHFMRRTYAQGWLCHATHSRVLCIPWTKFELTVAFRACLSYTLEDAAAFHLALKTAEEKERRRRREEGQAVARRHLYSYLSLKRKECRGRKKTPPKRPARFTLRFTTSCLCSTVELLLHHRALLFSARCAVYLLPHARSALQAPQRTRPTWRNLGGAAIFLVRFTPAAVHGCILLRVTPARCLDTPSIPTFAGFLAATLWNERT